MDAKVQRRVQRSGWDKAAASYERYWAAQLDAVHTRLLELAALAPGERVLDVACGSGLVTLRAADAVGDAGAVTGVDISDAMIDRLRETAARTRLTHVYAHRMDAEELRVDAGAFDVALCALGLMYFPEPRSAMREMMRALRPGGRLVVAVWGHRSECGWAEVFPIVAQRVESETWPNFFQLGEPGALVSLLDDAGCTGIVEERLSTTLRYESAEEACGAAFADGPVALAHSYFDDAMRQAVHADYLASIEPYRREADYAVPAAFVVARADKPAIAL